MQVHLVFEAFKFFIDADKITGSMQRAMDETDRRRAVQVEYNKTHGITPRSIIKSVADIMEGAYAATGKNKRDRKMAEAEAGFNFDGIT